MLQKAQVAVIAHDLFVDEEMIEDDDAICYSDKISKIANHQFVSEFSSGSGTVRYGTSLWSQQSSNNIGIDNSHMRE